MKFKILAYTVVDERTHARTHAQPEMNMPRQLLRSWGHNYYMYMCGRSRFDPSWAKFWTHIQFLVTTNLGTVSNSTKPGLGAWEVKTTAVGLAGNKLSPTTHVK